MNQKDPEKAEVAVSKGVSTSINLTDLVACY